MAKPDKDRRLFTQLVVDFHRHPKITRLPVEVRWTFIEMLGEARIADNDGVFSADDAEFLWPVENLEALVRSHPSRPLVERRDDGCYVIRDYSAHQQTRSEREALAETARRNGAKGGRPPKPKGNPTETQGVLVNNPGEPTRTQVKAESESESESESELDDLLLTESVSLGSNSDRNFQTDSTDSTDSKEEPEQIEACLRLAAGHQLDLPAIIELADRECARTITHRAALILGQHIIGKSRNKLKSPMRYVASAFKHPFEIQQFIDREVTT